MIRMWLTFLLFVGLIHLSITAVRALNGKERWALTKSLGYSIVVSLLAVLAMVLIVILF